MNRDSSKVTTGFSGLDEILDSLRIGDNVVWSVDDISDYQYFVSPFIAHALKLGKKVIYLRFASHKPLVKPGKGVFTYELDARRGFESFATRIHTIITEQGRGAFYVFDCLSNLLSAWATDAMIGQFFRVTCPYLFEMDTVAYFALMRGSHSHKTISRIRDTTQVLLGVYNMAGDMLIHPLKVWKRYSTTMFLPHIKEADRFIPVADSSSATRWLTSISRKDTKDARRQLDYWDLLFLKAEDLAQSPSSAGLQKKMIDQLCRVMIGRDERMLSLARSQFELKDLLEIKARLIGTGYIGGKALGMLLARNVLLHDKSFDWNSRLEPHDSFYVGSDVYYTYIVHNGWWKLLMQQKTPEGYFEVAAGLREKMRHGSFPVEVREEFQKMLEYFGQYPIIVRSSSLLEDSFGNAFAGKYDSFFCANQGTPEQRYEQFEEAVRNIFASTMSEDALSYRLQRGLDKQEELMALLIQRVSGAYRKHYYFPDLAGVGVSYNTFVWNNQMDPKAGMLRLVLGLGTRAVDRVEGDYPRIVALDAPLKRPLKGFEDTSRFSQRDVDLLNLESNAFQTVSLLNLAGEKLDLSLDRYGVKDHETSRRIKERRGIDHPAWILTFDRLLTETPLTNLMQQMLKTLEKAYDYPVDVEFTVNFSPEGSLLINPVQCRPLQTKGEEKKIQMPKKVDEQRIFFSSEGNFMGGAISQPVKRIIFVDPERYSKLPLSGKYDIARLVGFLNKQIENKEKLPVMLLGPGRWGTSTPSLGVPVSFSEINNITAIVEVAFTSGGLIPEPSYGTHFFQDLVETDIFYLALFPDNPECIFNKAWLDSLPNVLENLSPESGKYKKVLKVCDPGNQKLRLMADVVSQKVICFY